MKNLETKLQIAAAFFLYEIQLKVQKILLSLSIFQHIVALM